MSFYESIYLLLTRLRIINKNNGDDDYGFSCIVYNVYSGIIQMFDNNKKDGL